MLVDSADKFKVDTPHYPSAMVEAHPTTTPKQAQTDEWAVFADDPSGMHQNLQLVKRVEVPRYARPEAGAKKLSMDQRLQMAVQFAVTAEDSTFPVPGREPDKSDYAMVEGEEFMVMHSLDEPMAFATFERNPTVAGCWNPNDPMDDDETTLSSFTEEANE